MAVSAYRPALHYRLDGPEQGPVLVFSNSLGTDLRVWDPLLPHLSSGWRFLRYDKRGHGLSDLPDGDWGMSEHIGDLEALMDELGIADAVICGLSVGGMIAQGLAARRGDLARGLILMDTAAKIGTAEMWNARIEAIRAGGIESLAEAILERWFTKAFRTGAADFPLWRNMLRRTPRDGYTLTCAALRDSDLREQTTALQLPVLTMAGDQDGSTPPELVKETAALIEGARFELIVDAGHLPCVEQPEATAAAINAFLAENFGG